LKADSWGPQVFDPNAVSGIARITLSAVGTLVGVMVNQPQTNRYPMRFFSQPIPLLDNSKQRREDDSLLLLLL
jgi:hypothetical protein